MNERIQELLEQATLYAFEARFVPSDNPQPIADVVQEKFAELIVRECAQFVEDKFDFCGDEIIIAEEVKKYFGVEE